MKGLLVIAVISVLFLVSSSVHALEIINITYESDPGGEMAPGQSITVGLNEMHEVGGVWVFVRGRLLRFKSLREAMKAASKDKNGSIWVISGQRPTWKECHDNSFSDR